MTAIPRILKEYTEIKKEKGSPLEVWYVNGDVMHWKGVVPGPDGTPYAGGRFIVDIIFLKTYPFDPPKMRFDTPLWHPNVSSANGAICLDILNKEWSPALTLRTTLLSLQALLSCPNPDDPQDAVVAGEYKRDKPQWERHATEWTTKYAKPQQQQQQQQEIKQVNSFISSTSAVSENKSLESKQSMTSSASNLLTDEENKESLSSHSISTSQSSSSQQQQQRQQHHYTRSQSVKIEKLVALGFDRRKVQELLENNRWNEDRTIDILLNSR